MKLWFQEWTDDASPCGLHQKRLAFCSYISATTDVSTFRTLLSSIDICRGVNPTYEMEARTSWGSTNNGENVFQFHGDPLNMFVMFASFIYSLSLTKLAQRVMLNGSYGFTPFDNPLSSIKTPSWGLMLCWHEWRSSIFSRAALCQGTIDCLDDDQRGNFLSYELTTVETRPVVIDSCKDLFVLSYPIKLFPWCLYKVPWCIIEMIDNKVIRYTMIRPQPSLNLSIIVKRNKEIIANTTSKAIHWTFIQLLKYILWFRNLPMYISVLLGCMFR